MRSLRLLQWNVQLMPLLVSQGHIDIGEILYDPYGSKLKTLIPKLLDVDPDVVVLNEVFSEEARGRLKTELQATFPYIVPAFGPTKDQDLIALGKAQDSGLMFLSKHPLVTIGGEDHVFMPYTSSAGSDALAMKGVGLVIVEAPSPIGRIAIALTHLQAAYDTPDQHADLRKRQLRLVETTLNANLSSNTGPGSKVWEPQTLFVGDFNIVGNPPRPEWEEIFTNGPTSFNRHFQDAWELYMPTEDPGCTIADHHDSADELHRLDYVLIDRFRRPKRLVTQHMRLVNRGISDHYAVLSDLNWQSPHCTPRTAIEAKGLPSGASVGVEYAEPGSLQWLRFNESGTYLFAPDAESTVQVYEASNISEPLPDFDQMIVDVKQIPGATGVYERGTSAGRKFCVSKTPFFVRMARRDEMPGQGVLGWRLCQGHTPLDAIVLPAFQQIKFDKWPQEPPPASASLTNWEEAWFQVYMDALPDKLLQTIKFFVDNHSNGPLNLKIYDSNLQELLASGFQGGTALQLDFENAGGHSFYFSVTRQSLSQGGFGVRWESPLTYLAGIREVSGSYSTKLRLYCFNETGPDWLGSDEIVFDILENNNVLQHFPQGVDCWNANTGAYQCFPLNPIPFTDSLQVRISELENLVTDQTDTLTIEALPPGENGDDPNATSASRKKRVDLGYELNYQLCRSLPGASSTGLP